jgi:hypothetical protein
LSPAGDPAPGSFFARGRSHICVLQTDQGEIAMGKVYVEPRPMGGDAVDHYVVEDHAGHELAKFKTQKEAVDWAKKEGHTPMVARVRRLNDKKVPDHWREL